MNPGEDDFSSLPHPSLSYVNGILQAPLFEPDPERQPDAIPAPQPTARQARLLAKLNAPVTNADTRRLARAAGKRERKAARRHTGALRATVHDLTRED